MYKSAIVVLDLDIDVYGLVAMYFGFVLQIGTSSNFGTAPQNPLDQSKYTSFACWLLIDCLLVLSRLGETDMTSIVEFAVMQLSCDRLLPAAVAFGGGHYYDYFPRGFLAWLEAISMRAGTCGRGIS